MPLPILPGVPSTSLVVDINSYEVNADLAVAKVNGARAVILKATEGATNHDPGFITLHDKAIAAGLRLGVYHFGTARAPVEQVANFITTVTRVAGGFNNIVPALDLEHNELSPDNTISPNQGDEWVALFTERTGITPMLYAGGYLRDRGGANGRPNLARCPFWLADYETMPNPIPGCQDWSLWQFTDGSKGPYPGKVPGIGRCDQNIFKGDDAALQAFWDSFAPAARPAAAARAAAGEAAPRRPRSRRARAARQPHP